MCWVPLLLQITCFLVRCGARKLNFYIRYKNEDIYLRNLFKPPEYDLYSNNAA